MGDFANSRSPGAVIPPDVAASIVIPDHELIRLIGRGSYGEVWLARNALGTYRAAKVVFENAFRNRRPFDREFNGVQKIEPISRLHEGLVDILQVGRNDVDGYFYCVMELADDVVSGRTIVADRYLPRTLARDMAEHKTLPIEECRRVGASIASALAFLHRHELIHRDVKPSNIVFVNGVPKLADIGLVVESSGAKSYVGTEGFIPPEGPGTVQADLYSLGKVLYEISSGKDRRDYPELPTYLGEPLQKQQLMDFNRVIWNACRTDPRERYKSASALEADLLALGSGKPLRFQKAKWGFSWVLTVVMVLAGLGVGLLLLAAHWRARPSRGTMPKASVETANPIPAPEGLVAWWRGEGNGNDSAGNNRIAEMDGVEFGPGEAGQGFNFDGKAHRMIVSNAPALNVGAGEDFSIEAWIRPLRADTFLGLMCIVNKRSFSGAHQAVGYELSLIEGKLLFKLSDTPAYDNANYGGGEPDLRDGRFHHVAATVQRNSRRGGQLYVDGKVILTFDPTSESGDLSNSAPLRIGFNAIDDYRTFFFGTIDELSIYKRALTTAEIQSIHQAGAAGKRSHRPSSASFEPRVDLATENGPMHVMVADIDGDGYPDFVASCTYAHKISIFRNTGGQGPTSGISFELPINLPIAPKTEKINTPWGAAAGDLAEDGKMDLIVADSASNRLAIFKNVSSTGKIAFGEPIYLATGTVPRCPLVQDLDGDLRPDIAVVNNSSGTVSLFRNTGAPGAMTPASFATPVEISAGQGPQALAAGDLDGDGKPELVVANFESSTVSVLRNTSTAGIFNEQSFARAFELATPTNCVCVAITDLDGDGNADLVCGSYRGNAICIYQNLSTAGSLAANSFGPRLDLPADGYVNWLAVGDLNGDGKPEIINTTQMPDHLSVFPNLSAPGSLAVNSFGKRLDFHSAWNTWGVAIADFDVDGRPDVLFANTYTGTVSILRNVHPIPLNRLKAKHLK